MRVRLGVTHNICSNQKQTIGNVLSTHSSSIPSNRLPSTITGPVEQTPMEQSHPALGNTENAVELANSSSVNPDNIVKSDGVTNNPCVSHFSFKFKSIACTIRAVRPVCLLSLPN